MNHFNAAQDGRGTEIVHDDDVAEPQDWNKLLLDIGAGEVKAVRFWVSDMYAVCAVLKRHESVKGNHKALQPAAEPCGLFHRPNRACGTS